MPAPRTFAADCVPTLAEALGIRPSSAAGCEVVAFTGSGGKTTAMFRLASELGSRGERVLITTTTHIYPPDSQDSAATVLEDSLEALVGAARKALKRHSAVVLARGLDEDGKLLGIDPAWVEQLGNQLQIKYLLVEADGSRGRPFKAPAEHEPVIPPSADLVVPVVGLSVIGQPLSEEFVHRPERVAAMAGCRLGDTVSPSLVAAVLLHPEGSAKGAPKGARVVALLNQADDESRLQAGCEVAREMIERGAERVVIATLREAAPIRRVIARESSTVSAVVLAAGEGRRMESALKLALRIGGKSILRRVVETALASPVDEVVVVLGHGAQELEQELPGNARLRVVYNPDYATGQSSSLKAGVRAIAPQAQAAVFLLGDQPLISAQAIAALVSAFRNERSLVVRPLYRGTPGHPVLFSRALFPELLQVTGDQGGRELIARHETDVAMVELDLEPPVDIDTRDDYSQLERKFRDT